MKKCPFCAEEIQDEAVKCKHCGEFLVKKDKVGWIFNPVTMLMGFLCVGPFILPVVWLHPKWNMKVKVIVSVVMIVFTYYAGIQLVKSYQAMKDYYKIIFDSMPSI